MNSNEGQQSSRGDERLLSFFWRKPPNSLAEQTRRRVTLHLVPYLFFLYILAYLDRVNVSVAQLGMVRPPSEGGMGFDLVTCGFGAGIFFWGYWILEIPSTVSVVRWGARWVFVRILILWGLCAALVGVIGTPFASSLFGWLPHVPDHGGFISFLDSAGNQLFGWILTLMSKPGPLAVGSGTAHFINGLSDTPEYQFYFFRFLLGFFEGGFFPSVIVYLSLWFRTEDRAKAIAAFMAAIPLSNVLGSPLSGLIQRHIGWGGLAGWRWVFIVEGIVPIFAGFATLFFLPDRPTKAKWLTAEERDWLVGELEREHEAKRGQGHWAWVHHLGMVVLLTLVYFFLNFTSYGLSMFMPAIIKSQSGASDLAASCLAALPYVMGLLAMLINGWHSDHTGERIWHVAVPLTLSSLAIWLASSLNGWLAVLVMIFGVGTFLYAHLPAFWPIPTMFLGATAAASAIGFINMIGNLGGFFGPKVVGDSAAGQASFSVALQRIAVGPFLSAVIILILGYARRKRLKA